MGILGTENLFDAMAVRRSFDYTNPRASADPLPIVLGDCTGPASAGGGMIRAVQIDTVNDVWAVAGHGVLSVADGNSVSVYDDDGLIDPADYVFNPANNYESQGTIATLDFSAAPNGEPRVRMKGLNTGAALVENPVTAIESVLISLYGFPADVFEQSSLEAARQYCAGQAYKAAGVLEDDTVYADFMAGILAEFLGGFWTDGQKKIRFSFERTAAPVFSHLAGFLSELDIRGVRLASARRDIVNKVPVSYAYNPHRLQYELTKDGAANQDAASISLHGTRLPQDGRLRLRWVRETATVTAIQNVFIGRHAEGILSLTAHDLGAAGMELERGDFCVLSVSWLYDRDLNPLRNQIWRVISRSVDLQDQSVQWELEDTGYYIGSDGAVTNTGARKTEAIR